MGGTDTGDVPRGTDADEVRVLLVDDDEAWVTSTARILEHQRDAFTVTTATDLAGASAALAEATPDCVVCDYELGSGTGLDLLAEVRERDEDRPFILVTGQGDEAVASDAIGRQVTDYFPKRSLGGREDRLARRVETAVESYRTRRALARERRSKEAMLDILTATPSREGMAREFCDHLVRERDYACAWIGAADRSRGVVPKAAAGDEGYLDAAIDPDAAPDVGTEPALLALERQEPRVVAPIRESGDGWRAVAAEHGFGSAAAVPVSHEGTTFGVLAVYREGTTIGPEEQGLLEDYGRTAGYALRSADRRESLLSAAPVAVEIELSDGSVPLVAADRQLPEGSSIDVLTTVPREETLLYVVRIAGAPPAAVRSGVGEAAPVEGVTVTRTGEPPRCELVVTPPTPETVLTDHGGRVVDATAARGRASITAVGPDEAGIRSLVGAIRSAYPDAGIRSVRSPDAVTGHVSAADLTGVLTDKQRRAIEIAFYNGYFERPREHDTTQVAGKFGVARQTFTQHLRAGQRKLLAHLLDPPDD